MGRYVISIDPGSVHCGVAYWARVDGLTAETRAGRAGRPRTSDFEVWECHWAIEMTPASCTDYIKHATETDPPERVIIEGFWLDSSRAVQQAGSEMETTEVIGTVRHLCRWAGVPFDKVANGQGAIITRLAAAGYIWASHGNGGHAKDAEAVGVRGLGLKVKQLKSVIDARNAARRGERSKS